MRTAFPCQLARRLVSTDIPDRTKKLIHEREEERCALCRQPGIEIHHLWPKGMGGTSRDDIHDPQNLLGVDRRCHRWIHGNVAHSEAAGWIRPTAGTWMQNPNFAYPAFLVLTNDLLVTWIGDDEPEHLPPWMPRLRDAA